MTGPDDPSESEDQDLVTPDDDVVAVREDAKLLERLRDDGEQVLAEAFAVNRERFWHLVTFRMDRRIAVRRLSLAERGIRWAHKNPAVAALSALSALLLTSVAVLSTVGFVQVQSALDREQNTRRRAEATAVLASGALDQIFDRFSGTPEEQADSSDFSPTPALSAEAADLLEDLLHYYDALAARSNFDPKLRRSAVNARYAMGDIYFKLGDYDRAIDSLKLSLVESLDDAAANADQRPLRETRIRNRIGLAHRSNGNDIKAESQHQMSLDILTRKMESTEQPSRQLLFELARTHFLLAARLRPGMGPSAMPPLLAVIPQRHDGRPARRRPPRRLPRPQRGIGEDEKRHLQVAIEILRELHNADRDHVGYSLALAASLRQMENSEIDHSNTTKSSSESIQLLEELHRRNPENETVRFQLSEALAETYVFDFELNTAQLNHKIAQLKEALTHSELLSDANPNVPKYTNAVVHSHFKLGVLLEQLAEPTFQRSNRELEQQAGVSLREAAQRYAVLLRRHPNAPGYQAWYAIFLERQGGNALKNGLLEQAEQALLQSVDSWKQFIRTHPEEEIAMHALPETYELLSHTQHRMGKHSEAKESMTQAEMSRLYRDMQR